MAIIGLWTDSGIGKTMEAAGNEGWNIIPTEFGVSNAAGLLDTSRTDPNAGEWFRGLISSRVVVDTNTIKIICTIPLGAIPTGIEVIKEIYIYAYLDQGSGVTETFLISLGQPTENIQYDPTTSITFELQMAIVDIDITQNYVFNSTQATELEEHRYDPDSHPEIIKEMKYAGMFPAAGYFPQDWNGQNYIKDVQFGGTKATTSYNTLQWTARYNGTEGNSINVIADGVKTADELQQNWNNENPDNLVDHNGVGTEVPSDGIISLTSGTYSVSDRDIVYRDDDGLYKAALADNTLKTKLTGQARLADRLVVAQGFIKTPDIWPNGQLLYLSDTVPGAFTNTDTNVLVALSLSEGVAFLAGFGAAFGGGEATGYDAVVTDVPGAGHYPSTQEAIDAVAPGSSILIDKTELVSFTIEPAGEQYDITFNGPNTGWMRAAGSNQVNLVTFSSIPDSGTWRIEWNSQATRDMPFDADATTVASEMNLLAGHNGIVVTGDYTAGFVIEFLGFLFPSQPLTFTASGVNEIQKFVFSNVPTDGTLRLRFRGDTSPFIAFNDSNAEIDVDIERIASITEVDFSGGFSNQNFTIEWVGVDGNTPWSIVTPLITNTDSADFMEVIYSNLAVILPFDPTFINSLDPEASAGNLPIDATVIQAGSYPAANLKQGANTVFIVSTQSQQVTAVGPDICFNVDVPNMQITGRGVIENFEIGIELNEIKGTHLEVDFLNTVIPISSGGLRSEVDFQSTSSVGFSNELSGLTKLSEHPTNPFRVVLSSAETPLITGANLGRTLENLLVDFKGAEIDFSDGNIYDVDGVTIISTFTKPIITNSNWKWFSVALPETGPTADNRVGLTVAIGEGAVQDLDPELATRPEIQDGISAGYLKIKGAFGLNEVSTVQTIDDTNDILDGRYFIIFDSGLVVAEATDAGVNFTADVPGPIGNSISLVFTPSVTEVTDVTCIDAPSLAGTGFTLYDSSYWYSVDSGGGPVGTDPTPGGTEISLFSSDLASVVTTKTQLKTGGSVTGSTITVTDPLGPRENVTTPVDFGTNFTIAITTAGNLDTISKVTGAWNAINTTNTVSHDGVGTEVPTPKTISLSGGGSLPGTTSVAIWLDFTGSTPEPAHGASRSIKIDLVSNDDSITIATKLSAAINADASFSASNINNKTTITCLIIGPTSDVQVGTSAFFVAVEQQGKLPDSIGLEPIINPNIIQFGAGGGGGGGGGGWKTYPKANTIILNDGDIIPLERKRQQYWRVKSSGGPVTLDPNAFGVSPFWKDGDTIRLSGMDSTNYPIIRWSGGLQYGIDCNGQAELREGYIIEYQYDGVRELWTDSNRNF